MTMATKIELFRSCLERYLKANKQEKTKILDELAANTKMHRKAVIRALKREQMRDSSSGARRGPPERYGPAVTVVLQELWELSGELCAERLKPILPDYVVSIKQHNEWQYSETTTKLLLQMSEATMKRRISDFWKATHPKGYSTTKPSHLKEIIPVRTGPWENPEPGCGEIDTVVHCGTSLLGEMAYTVNYTDIATTWSECAAQLNKSQERTLTSIKRIRGRLPFSLKSLDPDTGSEFINYQCKEWCDENDIALTRSRPNHCNDNAHVEQKNYTVVRKLLGYSRIEDPKAIMLMNQLYGGSWRLFVNFFQPSMKCIAKERIGNRYRRKYDLPKTPYQRVLADPRIDEKIKESLRKLKTTLNPLALRREIDNLVSRILSFHRRR